MLINLSIQDYAVVERLEVDLATGMTCITGLAGDAGHARIEVHFEAVDDGVILY